MRTYDVVVIGGGIAGVTAARDMGEGGLSVVLLEAKNRLGGRTYYRRFANTEPAVEFGGTWIAPRWQRYVAREVERYDLSLTKSPERTSFASLVGGKRLETPWLVPRGEEPDCGSLMVGFVPGAKVPKVDAHHWNSDPYSLGTWMAFRPGQISRFGAGLRRPEGRLAFATADMATGWTGYIDGAIESGSRAAKRTRELLDARAASPARGSSLPTVVQLGVKGDERSMPGYVRAVRETAG